MDKKTEISLRTGQMPPQPEAATAASAPAAPTAAPPSTSAAPPAAPVTPATGQPPTGWWMYHGDPAHTGFVSDSGINSTNVNTQKGTVQPPFATLFTLSLEGPVLSVPAVSNGFVYVGLGNYQDAPDGSGNGGALHKINIQTGAIAKTFAWDLGTATRDIHSFTGMGCTPAVAYGQIYFGAFNGTLYCINEETLEQVWATDLRIAQQDAHGNAVHDQPITNNAGVADGGPAAVVWSSPLVSPDGSKVYVGCGEGENPQLYSFVFCLDTATGDVNWIYCTNQFDENSDNLPNYLPAAAVGVSNLSAKYTTVSNPPIIMGCSVWGAIAYDSDLNRIYCPTGNQAPEPNANWTWDYENPPTPPPFTPELPSLGYSNGVLALDADTGQFQAFFQVPPDSNYRPSDIDIDVGGAPIIFEWNGDGKGMRKVVGLGCKNGTFFVLDAVSLELLAQRQLLPYHNPPTPEQWIATVDPHPSPSDGAINPSIPNELSNQIPNENYSGVFNTPAIYPGSDDTPQTISSRVFLGMGGPNYHSQAPGIDYNSTPFMRAIDASTLEDAWPLDNGDPQRYVNTSYVDPNINTAVGMYTSAGESGISSPAVVNDVVFATTSKIAIYAFDIRDGTLLWYDDLGMQTDGYNGGYGYCLGAAIWQNYVVAGALVFGREGGGILRIYGLPQQPPVS